MSGQAKVKCSSAIVCGHKPAQYHIPEEVKRDIKRVLEQMWINSSGTKRGRKDMSRFFPPFFFLLPLPPPHTTSLHPPDPINRSAVYHASWQGLCLHTAKVVRSTADQHPIHPVLLESPRTLISAHQHFASSVLCGKAAIFLRLMFFILSLECYLFFIT